VHAFLAMALDGESAWHLHPCQNSLVPMQCGPWMPCGIEKCASVGIANY